MRHYTITIRDTGERFRVRADTVEDAAQIAAKRILRRGRIHTMRETETAAGSGMFRARVETQFYVSVEAKPLALLSRMFEENER
jgi:hypothetical protein